MEVQLLGHGNEILKMAEFNVSVPNIISPREVASRSRLVCKYRICHLRLDRCTPEGKPQFEESNVLSVGAISWVEIRIFRRIDG